MAYQCSLCDKLVDEVIVESIPSYPDRNFCGTCWGYHSGEICHCGEKSVYGYDGNPEHTRGLCETCDAVRCDAYPGECGR